MTSIALKGPSRPSRSLIPPVARRGGIAAILAGGGALIWTNLATVLNDALAAGIVMGAGLISAVPVLAILLESVPRTRHG